MSKYASQLSGTGCDFVVATTQASINSSLLEYLAEGSQPIEYVYFLADNIGNPTLSIGRDELLKKTGGVDPFDIPDQTPYNDPRITAVCQARFMIGFQMQMGLPPGVNPRDLSVVKLVGDRPERVLFNMYCSQATVIQNSPGIWGAGGSWNVWKQPSGQPWVAQAEVDLVVADLDHNLNNSAYLNQRPAIKEELRKALVNLSGSAFSLQQLLFDLDNAALQGDPQFPGMDMSKDAGYILQMYFVKRYQKSAKEHGLPLIAVTAVSQAPDPSSLQMTSYERTLTHPTGSSGPATTLNYLCVMDNHPTPSPYTRFDWNWVQPEEVDQSSGVVAIRWGVFVDFLKDNLKEQARSFCYEPLVSKDSIEFHPSSRGMDSGGISSAIPINWSYSAKNEGCFEPSGNGYMCQVELNPGASLTVTLEGHHVKVEQGLRVYAVCAHTIRDYDYASDGTIISYHDYPDPNASISANPFWKTLTTVYSLSVDSQGRLQLIRDGEPQINDRSEEIPSWTSDPNWQVSYDALRKIQEAVELCAIDLHEVKISSLNSFVFPGARVFTYKDPCFSEERDLICEITYLDPTEVSPAPPAQPESQPPQTTSTLPLNTCSGKLTVSTELMQNYVHGEIIAPTGKFEALQTKDGHALLFAIDSSGVFHVIEEQSGTLHTGWQVHDLSTEAIQVQFPGEASRAVARTFGVGQSVVDGSIGLMMSVHLDGNDHLFLSLGNSNQDLSWTTRPLWEMMPFDPAHELPQKITIAGALFAEAAEKEQYLMVDINRLSETTNEAEPHITRYHIDQARTTGHYWVKHDVTIDLAAGNYQSVVGRVQRKRVDGIYNAGTAGGQPQLIYEPIINETGAGPVNPRRLRLPGNAIPSAIATARNPEDQSTDLYCIGGSTLYRFASGQQSEAHEPLTLCTSQFLADTDTLRAMTHEGMTTLWGRNRSDQVYYLACSTNQLSDPTAWSAPFPILSGIERISAFLNCADGGNTIFAAGNGRVQKVMQGSAAIDRVWRAQEITITAASDQPCTSFRSYTTTIRVTELASNAPVSRAPVELEASSRTPVYINGVYYVLSAETPVQVLADVSGALTVIEATDSLQAAVLTVSLANTSVKINPMDQSVAKITALDTVEKLRAARVPIHTVAGGIDGSTTFTPLVSPSADEQDVKAVAQNMILLKGAYDNIQAPTQTMCQSSHQTGVLATAPVHLAVATTKVLNLGFLGDIWNGVGVIIGDIEKTIDSIGSVISTTWGDAWAWLKNGAERLGRIFYDTATSTLHFLGNIAGQIYHATLNTVQAVVGAIEWGWGKIKDGSKQLVDWAMVLLDWKDIRRTKQVTHNLIRLWMQHQVDQIPQVAARWDQAITGLEQTINQWAGTTNFAPLGADGEVMKKPAAEGAADPNEGQTSASQLFARHYRNHAHQLTVVGDSPALDGVEGLLSDLLAAVSKEGAVLGAVFDQLQRLLREFSSLSLEEVLKRLMGILADGVLSSAQVVIDTLLKVLYTLTSSALAVLDTKIHIPVISDLLNWVGIPDISFLDLFTWIIAVAYTVAYKITHDSHAPFPAHPSVSALIAASSWEELSGLFGRSASSFAATTRPSTQLVISEADSSSSELQDMIFAPGHALAGLAGLVLGSVSVFEAESETAESPFATPAMILGIVGAALQGVTNHFAPRDPIANEIVERCEWALLGLEVLVKVFFAEKTQGALTQLGNRSASVGKLVVSNARGLEAIVDAVLILPAIAITGWHIGELAQKPAGKVKSAAILEECGKVASWISRCAYAIALNDPEPDSKELAVGLTGLAIWIAAGFQLGEAEWC